MLVLTLRHGGESNDHIQLQTPAGEIKVEILAVRNGKVRLGVHCGDAVTVLRKKVAERTDPEWESIDGPPGSTLWSQAIPGGKVCVESWQYWQDSSGRVFRSRGQVWQQRIQEVSR